MAVVGWQTRFYKSYRYVKILEASCARNVPSFNYRSVKFLGYHPLGLLQFVCVEKSFSISLVPGVSF